MAFIRSCIPAAILAAAAPATALAQDQSIAFEDRAFVRSGDRGEVAVETFRGREALVVRRSTVMLQGAELSDGVIEFDIAFENKFGFGGLLWRAQDPANSEYFYLRQHKSGEVDAGQYTPVRGGLTSWQLYTDPNGIQPFAYTYDGWNRVRVVTLGDRAEIYFNGSAEPVMHIPDLAADRARGGIGFRASGPNGEIYLSNIVVRDLAPGDAIVGAPAEETPPPAGTIERWLVSGPFPEARVTGHMELPQGLASTGAEVELAVDRDGIADLSRAVTIGDEEDTVLVSTALVADGARRTRLIFGYSDRVRLYLNGELIFAAAAGWRTRDNQFLGTVGFFDSVVLPLRDGENRLTAAVSETFGGWAWAAALENGEGVNARPR